MSSIKPGDRLGARLRATMGAVLLGGLPGILNSSMAAVATDTLATVLSTVGWASTGFLLAVTATIPLTIWAVDRFGGKRLWLIGLTVFVAGALAAGLACNVGGLIAFRSLQGVGAGCWIPSC